MTQVAEKFVSVGKTGKLRLSDDELHRAVCKAIHTSNHVVFESMPSLIRQIIEHATWKSYRHEDFASYALDETSNGLGVNNNQRLWILRCSMDVHDKHIKEWADVLAKVEEMVKLIPVKDRGPTAGFNGNSLETLAKDVSRHLDKITYLPSKSRHGDGKLLSLRGKPALFTRVVSGKLSVEEAVKRSSGRSEANHLAQAKYYIKKLDAEQLRALVKWMKGEGYLK